MHALAKGTARASGLCHYLSILDAALRVDGRGQRANWRCESRILPNLTLTGLGGLESNALHQFITAPAETWYAAFNVSQPA